jgi:hypothetical protein
MNGMMTKGLGNLLEALRDPIGTSIHTRENKQHSNLAIKYGMADLEQFLETYTELECGQAAIDRYSKNLKSYLENAL